jgi:hypothetical protein
MARRTRRSQRLEEAQTPDALVKTRASIELSKQASTASPAIDAVGQSTNTGDLTPPQTNLIGRSNIPESERSKPSERERKTHLFLP